MAQVRISDPGIGEAYRRITASDPNIDYMLLSYAGQSNDLKVQEQGTGGLAELEDSWNDGRIQFAFVRVKEEDSGLTKFVLIAWCGDGVLESRKGLFHSHASAVAQFLKGYHVQINARCDTDVDPSRIMRKVADSSGAKYSIHNEKPVKREMPAPVGTNYKPIGRPDIAAMTNKQKPTPPGPVGTSYTSMKNELAEIRAARAAPSAASLTARAPISPAVNAEEFEPTIKATPPPPIIAPRPTVIQAAVAPKSAQDNNEKEERPGYVGTAYTPVSLGKPGKLGSRLSAFSSPQESNLSVPAANNGKKLTWAERQAEAKRVAAEEEAQSLAAIERSTTSMKQIPIAVPAPVFNSAPVRPAPVSEDEFETPIRQQVGSDESTVSEVAQPPRPPSPPCVTAEPISETSHPPPPPPPPLPALTVQTPTFASTHPPEVDYVEEVARAEAQLEQKMGTLTLMPENTTIDPPDSNLRAVVIYDYQQADTDEMGLSEGEIIINIQQIDEGWWTGMSADGSRQGLFPATCVNLITEGSEETQEVAAEVAAEVADRGIIATAMYDYEAGEDNEITFQEGEEIFEIEYSSEDWWTGTVSSTNQRGLFPANYVELRQ